MGAHLWCRLKKRGGRSPLHLGRRFLFKYCYPFSAALLGASHSYTSLSQHGSSALQIPPRSTFSSQSSGAVDVHPPGLGWGYHTSPSLDTHVPQAGRSQQCVSMRGIHPKQGEEGKLNTLGLLWDWGSWGLVTHCTWNRKGNLGFWSEVSKQRSGPGSWFLIYILFPS